MAPLEEPGVAEMIRTLGSKVDLTNAALLRVESVLHTYVTQEQRTADQALAAEREIRQNEKITALETAQASRVRIWTSSVLAPLLVGVLVWLITRGTA